MQTWHDVAWHGGCDTPTRASTLFVSVKGEGRGEGYLQPAVASLTVCGQRWRAPLRRACWCACWVSRVHGVQYPCLAIRPELCACNLHLRPNASALAPTTSAGRGGRGWARQHCCPGGGGVVGGGGARRLCVTVWLYCVRHAAATTAARFVLTRTHTRTQEHQATVCSCVMAAAVHCIGASTVVGPPASHGRV